MTNNLDGFVNVSEHVFHNLKGAHASIVAVGAHLSLEVMKVVFDAESDQLAIATVVIFIIGVAFNKFIPDIHVLFVPNFGLVMEVAFEALRGQVSD